MSNVYVSMHRYLTDLTDRYLIHRYLTDRYL